MPFPFGKPVLVMLIASMLSGIAVLFHRPAARTDLTIWTFAADRGYQLDSSILASYEEQNHLSVSVKVLSPRGLDTRLISMFMQSAKDTQTPDIVEIEIGSVGKFLRPPNAAIGLLPWNDYLDRTGLRDKFVATRLAVWSKRGEIFGLPQDLHPVSLTYRKDLFDQAGVDPTTSQTWPQLQQSCLQFERYWHSHGEPLRHAMELNSHSTDSLSMILQQRHINLIDGDNIIHLNDPKATRTLVFYTSLITGPGQIAGDANPGGTRWMNDVSKGDLCMILTPDWRASDLIQLTPDLRGKLAMMPLPRFDPDDAPTASWGGTMIGIPRDCPHPEEARKLAVYLTTDPGALKANRLAGFDLIPPLPDRWADPIYHQPNPFYANQQSVDDLYVRLARQMPPRYVTPFTAVAETEFADVLSKAVAYRANYGEDGLADRCQHWLDDAAADLARRMQFGTFDN